MIQASKLQSVINEVTRYKTAILAFKSAYGQFPGDFDNAWTYWGANCGGGVQGQCNGNGNNILEGTPIGGIEDYKAWEHLSLARMINEKMIFFNGFNIGVSMPRSKLGNNATYWYWSMLAVNPMGSILLGTTGRTDAAPWPNAGVFSPMDAYFIDSKMDDGKPMIGKVISFRSQDRSADATICVSAAFIFSDKTKSCYMNFIP